MCMGCSPRSVTRVCAGGWSCRHLLAGMFRHSRPSRRKAGVQHKAHCLHKQFNKHRVLGALPRLQSPGVRQGPTPQASLSENGNLRPAMLMLFVPPASSQGICMHWKSLRLAGLVDKAGSIDFISGYCVTHDKLLDHTESDISISNSEAMFPPREVKSTS